MNEYPFTSLITLALVLLGWYLASIVGNARATFAEQRKNPDMWHSVEIYGDVNFMVAFRNHLNFLENLILFIPTLWIFAVGISDKAAFVVGLTYLIGRIWWARNYPRNFSHRPAFFLSFLSFLTLLLGAAGSTIYQLLL